MRIISNGIDFSIAFYGKCKKCKCKFKCDKKEVKYQMILRKEIYMINCPNCSNEVIVKDIE